MHTGKPLNVAKKTEIPQPLFAGEALWETSVGLLADGDDPALTTRGLTGVEEGVPGETSHACPVVPGPGGTVIETTEAAPGVS
jgi:hypothetical protein